MGGFSSAYIPAANPSGVQEVKFGDWIRFTEDGKTWHNCTFFEVTDDGDVIGRYWEEVDANEGQLAKSYGWPGDDYINLSGYKVMAYEFVCFKDDERFALGNFI